jgi:hypothetical protein
MSDSVNDCNRNSLATNRSVSVINYTMRAGIVEIASKVLGFSVSFIKVIIYTLVRILNLQVHRSGNRILKTFVRYCNCFLEKQLLN